MVEYINDEIKMYVIRKYTTLGSKLDLIIDGELQDLSQFDELPCKAKTTHFTTLQYVHHHLGFTTHTDKKN